MMMLLLVSCPQAGGGQGGRQGWRPVAKTSGTSDKIFRERQEIRQETRDRRDEGDRPPRLPPPPHLHCLGRMG